MNFPPEFGELERELATIRHEKMMETKELQHKLDMLNSKFSRRESDVRNRFFDRISDEAVLAILDPFPSPEPHLIEKIKWVRNEIYIEWGIHSPLLWTKKFVERNL